jgi:hypothetical protein
MGNSGAAGGGGRIAVYAQFNLAGDFRPRLSASGGATSGNNPGAPGTVYVDTDTIRRSLGIVNSAGGAINAQTYVTDTAVDLLFDTVQAANICQGCLVRWWAPSVSDTAIGARTLSVAVLSGAGSALDATTVSGQRVVWGYASCSTAMALSTSVSKFLNASASGFFASSTSDAYTMQPARPLLCTYPAQPLAMNKLAVVTIASGSTLWLPPAVTLAMPTLFWGGVIAAVVNVTISSPSVTVASSASTQGSPANTLSFFSAVVQSSTTLNLAPSVAVTASALTLGGCTIPSVSAATFTATSLTVASGTSVTAPQSVWSAQVMTVASLATIACTVGTCSFYANSSFAVAGIISADGAGFAGAPGCGGSGCSVPGSGPCGGTGNNAGGGHAGSGYGSSCSSYGSAFWPTTLGSGGATGSSCENAFAAAALAAARCLCKPVAHSPWRQPASCPLAA